MHNRTSKASYKHNSSNSHANTEHTVNSSDSDSSNKHVGKLKHRGSSNERGEAKAVNKTSKTITTSKTAGQHRRSNHDVDDALRLTNIARNRNKQQASANIKVKAKTKGNADERKTKTGNSQSKGVTVLPASDSIGEDVSNSSDDRTRVPRNNNPQLRSIDTMEMDADLTENEIVKAIERLKLMVNSKTARRVTKERKFWRAIFSVPLGTGRQDDRSVSITFYFDCTAHNSNVPFRIQFNAGLIQEQHVRRLMAVFKEVFPFDYASVARSLRFHGVDEAYDHAGSLEDFVLERLRTTTVERYYIKTNAGGSIQTAYIGSHASPSHGVLYDLGSADAYRNALGQAVPLNKDTATHSFVERKGMIRIESRRVFDKPLTLQQLLELPSAFREYRFFDLTRLSRRDRLDPVLMGFVDSVRLRGVHSASKRLEEAFGGGRAAKRRVKEFEHRLADCGCTWWQALDHQQQLGVLLKNAPIWRFLRRTAKLA
jgi:hypothetical protein